MLPKELFKNVRRIQITTSRLATDVFSGQYQSVFKGRGMEFDEVREYQFGDDIRSIDWNVTARTGRPHVKKFVEEREMTVMIMVDASKSCRFASGGQLKSKLAAEMAAVLAFSAIKNNDKIGLIVFTDQIEKFIPPRKGIRHVLRVIREILYFEPKGVETDIAGAMEYLSRVTKRKAVSFLISDFYWKGDDDTELSKERFKKALSIANKRHDMIAITLNDPVERELPLCGIIELEDAETGEKILVDTLDQETQKKYKQDALCRLEERESLFRSVGVDHIDIDTNVPYSSALVKFFMKRKKRFVK